MKFSKKTEKSSYANNQTDKTHFFSEPSKEIDITDINQNLETTELLLSDSFTVTDHADDQAMDSCPNFKREEVFEPTTYRKAVQSDEALKLQ